MTLDEFFTELADAWREADYAKVSPDVRGRSVLRIHQSFDEYGMCPLNYLAHRRTGEFHTNCAWHLLAEILQLDVDDAALIVDAADDTCQGLPLAELAHTERGSLVSAVRQRLFQTLGLGGAQ